MIMISIALFVLCVRMFDPSYAFSLNHSSNTRSRKLVRQHTTNMGLGSALSGIFKGFKQRSDAELKNGIANFYDQTTGIWLDVWGEHLHHGYYPSKGYRDHLTAQIDMIDKSLEWGYGDEAATAKPKSMVDVGCGVGGSSRHIVKKYGCTGRGVSLSPYQIQRANLYTKNAGLDAKLQYAVEDAMNMKVPDNTYDLTWSMESGEHMPSKERFLQELIRVTAPGGRILIITWCHRELSATETSLTKKELNLLNKINNAYFLPDWVPGSLYVKLANQYGLEDVRFADWTEYVAPFWPAVIRSALKPKNLFRMLRSGFILLRSAFATLWMRRGFQKGLIKFVLITGKKPVIEA